MKDVYPRIARADIPKVKREQCIIHTDETNGALALYRGETAPDEQGRVFAVFQINQSRCLKFLVDEERS